MDTQKLVGDYRRQSLWFLGGLVGFMVLVWLLSPILTPFVVAAGLAYVGDPIVDKFEDMRLTRTAGVSIVFLAVFIASVLLVLSLAPMLQDQISTLMQRVPDGAAYAQSTLLPKIGITLPERLSFDVEALRKIVADNWSQAGGVAANIWGSVSASSAALMGFLANLLLIPVVAFYLLRDWDVIVGKIDNLVPPRHLETVRGLARETDDVLGAFMRGQVSVMFVLAVLYVIGLWLVGLELALLVGIIAGLISFVPYLGMIVGILLATLAMLLQEPGWLPLLLVWGVFAVGQVIESAVLTPLLVGDRIGLHPVAVIFAVLAGGQLFGFVGVLLALPVAAALAVLLRFGVRQWFASALFRGVAMPDDSAVASTDNAADLESAAADSPSVEAEAGDMLAEPVDPPTA